MVKRPYLEASNLSGSLRIKDLPLYQRPREKALRYGVDSLSNAELLAIIINSGTKNQSALKLAENLLNKYYGLTNIAKITEISDLSIKGIKSSKAITLLAAFKLGDRIRKEQYASVSTIATSADIANKYLYDFSSARAEMLLLVALDSKLNILKEQVLYVGTKRGFDIDVKAVITTLLKLQANHFILVHNHPSGSIYPSHEDVETTKQIQQCAKDEKITLFDHLIIASYSYFSFRDNELL